MRTNFFYACMFACVGLSACSNGNTLDDTTPEANGLFNFTVEDTSDNTSKISGEEMNLWETGDSIYMSYIQDNETTDNISDIFDLRKSLYKAKEDGASVELVSISSPITTDFQNAGASSIDIFAFSANHYDLFEKVKYNEQYKINLTETSRAGVLTNTVAAFKNGVTVADAGGTIALNFGHLMASVRVKFDSGTDPDLVKDMNIYVTGVPSTVTHTFGFLVATNEPIIVTKVDTTNALSVANDTIWFQDVMDKNYGEYDFVAEFPPVDVNPSIPFIVHFETADGETHYTYTIDHDFEDAHVYTMTVSFPNDGTPGQFEITTGTWSEWLLSLSVAYGNGFRDENGDYYTNFSND